MIYLELLWTFFKIGLFTIGGGHAMIPLIMSEVSAHGWIDQQVLIDFVERAGVLGAVCATLGVVLPSLIVIIIVAKFFSRYMNVPVVQEVFDSVSGAVSGLLLSVVITVGILVLFGMDGLFDGASFTFDPIGLGLFAAITVLAFVKIKGKRIPPILLIVISAVAGVLLYGFIPV